MSRLLSIGVGKEAEPCEWCGGIALIGTTCPRSLACPTCKAAPGAPCIRPSGHRAATLHTARVERAEIVDGWNGINHPTEATP